MKYTLVIGLSFFIESYSTQSNVLLAAAVAIVVPPVILFFFGQRNFVEGVTVTGVKM